MKKYARIEIVIPQHVADSWEDKLPLKRAVKKIVDESQADIIVTKGLMGCRKEL